MEHDLEEIKKRLAEGLNVEHELDVFLEDWQKNKTPRPPKLWTRLRRQIEMFKAPIIVLSVIFGITFFIGYVIRSSPTSTQRGWHPNTSSWGWRKDCLRFGETRILICPNDSQISADMSRSNSPLIWLNLQRNWESCTFGLTRCKQDIEAKFNQLAEFEREFAK